MKGTHTLAAVLLSAGIASGTSSGASLPVEQTKENTFQILSGKESLKQLKGDIANNTQLYVVQRGDTIASLSTHAGISIDELVDLNNFLSKPLVRRGNNVIIKLGESIFVPKDLGVFRAQFDRMTEQAKIEKLNQKVQSGDLRALDIEPIFPSSVLSIGLPKVLSGFMRSQEISYDPNHPKVVGSQWQEKTTCSNAMRAAMRQSMNMSDLSPKEQAFQLKQNVDAWMLPTELMAIGYEQLFPEIMDMFDSSSIGSANPIKKDKERDYQKAVRSMHALLEAGGDSLAGSFVPEYFKRSHYKKDVVEYNKPRKDKHYNTHQSMFAGAGTMKFAAWNVPVVRNGAMEAFGGDKKNILKEIEQLKKETLQIHSESVNVLQQIINSTDSKNNPELAKKLLRHVSVIESRVKLQKNISPEEIETKKEHIISILNEWLLNKQDSYIEKLQKNVPGYKVTPDEMAYLASFIAYSNELERFIDAFQKTVLSSADTPIDGTKFGPTVGTNSLIQQAIETHNASLKRLIEIKKIIALKETVGEKPTESISVIDFILNFVQSRSDFGGSLSDGYRKEILQGLSIYGDLIKLKINGVSVDILKELEIYKAGKSRGMIVSPDHVFEITGPMMVDGEKQSTHADVSRQKYMNIRTRFFFEFFLSQAYLPTELLIPGKDLSYLQGDQSRNVRDLKIKGVYGLNIKYNEQGEFRRNKNNQVMSETIEEVLKREIVRYENLDPTDPKLPEKIRYYYALQIKALQMAGFLQDENTLNEGATNINAVIPYFDPLNITKVYASYIRDKKREIYAENKRNAGIKTFINIHIFENYTYNHIYNDILDNTKDISDIEKTYPYMSRLGRMPDYKKRMFTEKLLSSASHDSNFDARKFLENPKPRKPFTLSLDALERELRALAEITHTEYFSYISPVDNRVIELVTTDESYRSMLSNILAVESYGESGGFFTRRNVKKIVKNISGYGSSSGDYQLRIAPLLADLNKNKTLDDSIQNMLRIFANPETQSFLQKLGFRDQISKDLGHIEAIKNAIKNPESPSLMRKIIAKELGLILRFDTGDGSNVVGKLASASLLMDKLALHSEKLDYMLIAAGYNLPSIFDNPALMRQYERTIIRINNLPENQMLLALAENFVIRIGGSLSGKPLETKSVFDVALLSKGRYLGQIKYNKNVFLDHMGDYRHVLETNQTNPKIGFFLKKLDLFVENMTNNPLNTNETIYAFIRDKELRAFLDAQDIDDSLIPQDEEWSNNAFARSVFHYVNKISEIMKRKLAQK